MGRKEVPVEGKKLALPELVNIGDMTSTDRKPAHRKRLIAIARLL